MNVTARFDGQAAHGGLTTYRPFIDGLRAVSILAVVLYHVGVPGIPGGYIGVDVFFVISGFLIISQIVDNLQRGKFAFGDFWARRALRILPPYLLVLGAAIVAAPFILVMPEELKEFSREARDGGLMIINHLFLAQQGYFDTAADSKPLLHLWSLAVEEQFYLAAPLLLAFLWWLPARLGRPDRRLHVVAASAALVFVASLAACILFTSTRGANPAFYLTALRGWEFVAGGAVGLLLPLAWRLPRRLLGPLAAAGLAAIVAAALTYDASTPYPSWRALVPVLGATALIVGGIAGPKSMAVRLLATPPMVFLGLVSYAWYLWHWPLLAFSRIANFGERDFRTDVILGLLSLALAIGTHFLIEQPIRHWRRRGARLGWRPVIIGVSACGLAALIGFQTMQVFERRSAEAIATEFTPQHLAEGSFCDLMQGNAEACSAAAAGLPLGLLVGDSQMMASRAMLSDIMRDKGTATASLAALACGPFLQTKMFVGGEFGAICERGREHAAQELARGVLTPSYAILFGQWQWYGDGLTVGLGMPGASEPDPDQRQAFVAGLHATFETLRGHGVRRILIIGPTPLFPRLVPPCLYRASRRGLDPAAECGVAWFDVDGQTAAARASIHAAIAGAPDVRLIDPLPQFCDAERCVPFADDAILITDGTHVSDAAVARLAAAHRADFEWVAGKAP